MADGADLGRARLRRPSFAPTFTGLAPDAIRATAPAPQLSLFLYHVEIDNAQELALLGLADADAARASRSSYLPLALNLYYLLSAYSEELLRPSSRR